MAGRFQAHKEGRVTGSEWAGGTEEEEAGPNEAGHTEELPAED